MKTRDDILTRIRYAEAFTPHKVEYYKGILRHFDEYNKVPPFIHNGIDYTIKDLEEFVFECWQD